MPYKENNKKSMRSIKKIHEKASGIRSPDAGRENKSRSNAIQMDGIFGCVGLGSLLIIDAKTMYFPQGQLNPFCWPRRKLFLPSPISSVKVEEDYSSSSRIFLIADPSSILVSERTVLCSIHF